MYRLYFLSIILLLTMATAESKYKEPQFNLISKDGNVEIREYSKYVVAKTTHNLTDDNNENNMYNLLKNILNNINYNKGDDINSELIDAYFKQYNIQ